VSRLQVDIKCENAGGFERQAGGSSVVMTAPEYGTEPFLAFGGLTWDEFERVESGLRRFFLEGIVANQVERPRLP